LLSYKTFLALTLQLDFVAFLWPDHALGMVTSRAASVKTLIPPPHGQNRSRITV